MNTYEQQAQAFAQKHSVTLTCTFLKHDKYFPSDTEKRDVYTCTLTRTTTNQKYEFTFGQSIAKNQDTLGQKLIKPMRSLTTKKSIAPTMYDVLSCLTKSDPGTFEDFCSDFGYDTDSRRAMDTYLSVQKEWSGVKRLFADVLDELQEIN